MRKLKLFLSLLMLMAFSIGQVWAAETKLATLDFTTNTAWGFPEGSGSGITEATDYSDGTYTINVSATTKYYFNTTGYLMIGKNGSQLKLPAFTWKTTKIVVTGNSGASGDTKQNIYVGTTAVSTQTTSSKTTQTYNIASAYQAAGNVYIFQVCSNHNAQVTKIEVYGEAEAPKPTLSSIAVKTAPTKVTYTEGEFFDPAGLVITATYSDASTSDVAYKDNEDKFSFSPALNEALETTDAQVTITYGEKSANQAITVNAAAPCTSEITITKGTPEHGSFDLTGAGTVCIDGGNASATVSNIEAADGYRFKEITTDAGTVDGMDITDIDANTTINVVFELIPSHKVYFYNGATLLNEGGTDVKEGAAVAYSGSTPESCDSGEGASTNFAGWATDVWDGKVAKANIVPDFYDGALPVMGENDVTYYAVFCKGGNGIGGITQDEITTAVGKQTDASSTYASRTFESASGNWTGSFAHNEQNSKKVMQLNKTAGNSIISPIFGGSISNVEITYTNASGKSRNFILKNGDNSLGTLATVASTTEGVVSANISGSYTSFVITVSDALYIHSIRVTYGTEASNYMTTCCTKHTITVDDKIANGSVTASLAEACENTKVKLTPTPAAHCQFVSWNVKDEDEGSIDVAADSTFTMPDKDVTVSATFEEIKNAVTFATPTGGTLVVKRNDATVSTGDLIKEGETVKLVYAADAVNHYIGGTVTVKDASNDDVVVAADSTFVMPGKAVTISASFTATYAINIEADGGNVALDYTKGGAEDGYAIAGTGIIATATADDAHTFSALALSKNVTEKDIDANVATFTMPAEAVTITATFAVKTTPTIGVSPEIIEFAPVDYKGALAAQTFNVSGAALAAGKLSISCDNAAFTVSPAEIDVDGALAATEVTVTPKTTSCGTFDGTITISGGNAEAKEVLVSLTVNKLAANLSWSASEYTATIGESNEFPTLNNPRGLENVVYSSSDEDVVTVNATTGAITELKKADQAFIIANFAGNDSVAAIAVDELLYTLTVQKKYTAKWYVNGTPVDEQTDLAGTDLKTFPSDFSSFTDCSELEFQGWLTAPLGEASASKPAGLITETTGLTMPEEDINYYAVFATKEGTDVPAGYSLSTSAPANGDKVIITRLVSGTYYALKTDVATTALTITDGVVSEPADGVIWDLAEATYGFYVYPTGQTDNSLHLNSSALKVAAGTTNGDIGFSANGDNSFKAARYNSETADRWIVVSGANGLGCSSTEANAAALYIFKYSAGSSATRKDYVTTCPSCTKVELNAVAVEHGSIALSSTLVKTCDPAKVTVTPDPATGYELTNVALSGVAGATYADGEISIPAEASGTLDVTATFSAINYTVTMEQTGGASATLTGATDEAHYNGTINITAEDKDGYIFNGWTSDPVVTFEDNEALETSFSMPNSDVTITASYTKILTVAEAIALVDEDKTATHTNSYVSGLISNVESYNSTYNSITYWVSDNGQTDALQIYGGLGLNGAKFSSEEDLHVGDKVVVKGDLIWYSKGSKYEINKDNVLYSYEAINATPTSIAISGTPDVTKYAEGQIFNPEGLVVTATYNTGYQADVTSAVEWSNDLEDGKVMADGTVKVTAKLGEVVSAAYDVEVELAEQAPAFSVEAGRYTSAQTVALTAAEGAKIYYTTDGTEPTKESALYSTAIELNERKVYTIKAFASGVKGESQIVSAVYNINLPYTFAELVAADLPSGSEDIVVTVDNNISEIPTSTTYGVFVDQKDKTGTKDVEIYYNGHAIPSSWKVGGHLSGTVTGTWTLYEGATSSIWEIVPESSFEWTNLSYTKPKAPISWPSATASVYTAGKSNTWQKLNNEAGVSVTYSCDDAGAVTIDPSTGFITIVKAGVTVITASTDGNDDYSANVAEYTLTVVGPKSLTIEGSLVNDKYEAGQSFNRTGLSATVTYTDDETSDVTSAAEWSFDPATITEDADVIVTATWNAMNANKVVAVSVNKHTVSFTAAPANGTVVVATDAKGLSPIATGDEFVKGTVLYVIATPDASFKVNERLAISGGSSDILVKDGDDYKFTVGTEDVEVIVSFTASGTALDNTEASEKVVKTMENGVLIIRRGDKTYNGQGQLIK